VHKHIQIALTPLVAAALLFSVTPASAAPGSLPAGELLYAFGCDPGFSRPAVGLVDVATGAVTEVVPQGAFQCLSSAAYNAVDGLMYVVDFYNNELEVFDPEAQTLTFVDEFSAGCLGAALAIDASGNAWVHDIISETLRPFNLEDATCGTGVGVSDGGGAHAFYAMAFAPNGTLYGISGEDGTIGTINTTTGAFTQVGSSAMADANGDDLKFDSTGTAWALDWSNISELYSADIANYAGTADLSGQLTYAGDFYAGAIAVLPAPEAPEPETEELADTGVDEVARVAIGVAAAGLIALGAAARIVRRRAS